MITFVVINSIFFQWFSHYKSSEAEEDFAAENLEHSATRPDVVFCGSSTIQFPLADLDLTQGNLEEYDAIEHYCRVTCVEKLLSKKLKRSVQANIIASMGFMVSDDFFLVNNYLKNNHAPPLLVVMVAPRDFYDANFESPAAGIAFRKLSDWSRMLEFCGTYLSSPVDYIDYLVGRSIFVFSIRGKIQEKAQKFASTHWYHLQDKLGIAVQKQSPTEKSLKEYRTRYRQISFSAMDRQFVFLDKLLKLCKERKIKTILVNAPLTEANIGLLPSRLYQSYCEKLASFGMAGAWKYVDLSKSRRFALADFTDTVHLNEHGAEKLIDLLLPDMYSAIDQSELDSKHSWATVE